MIGAKPQYPYYQQQPYYGGGGVYNPGFIGGGGQGLYGQPYYGQGFGGGRGCGK